MTDKKTEFIVDGAKADDCAWEITLAKRCADHLQSHYPGHPWAVNVNKDGGTVNIFNLSFSQDYGYLLYTTTVENDSQLKCVMRAGGELLERANLAKQFNGDIALTVDGMPDKYHIGKKINLN